MKVCIPLVSHDHKPYHSTLVFHMLCCSHKISNSKKAVHRRNYYPINIVASESIKTSITIVAQQDYTNNSGQVCSCKKQQARAVWNMDDRYLRCIVSAVSWLAYISSGSPTSKLNLERDERGICSNTVHSGRISTWTGIPHEWGIQTQVSNIKILLQNPFISFSTERRADQR